MRCPPVVHGCAVTGTGRQARPSIVVDCDPGIDDALALLFLARLHHRGLAKLQAVVTVAGNAAVATTTRNARFILDRAGLPGVPVIGGAAAPLTPPPAPIDALAFHGPDALGGSYLPSGPETDPGLAGDGPRAIVDHLRDAAGRGDAVLLAVGPLTNVALALDLDPGLHHLTRRVVVMGGAFGNPGGNVTPTAEFNWYCDPDAADRVLCSKLPLEIVPLDVTEQVTIGPASLGGLAADPAAALAGQLLCSSIDLHRAAGYANSCHVHDALAAAAVVEPDLLQSQRFRVRVGTSGPDRGRAVFEPSNLGPGGDSGRPDVALGVDADRARTLMLSVLGG